MSFSPEKLREFVADSGVSYRQNSRSYIFGCPRCGKKDKLYLRKADGRFVCWVCRELDPPFKGKGEYALTEITNVPISQIRRLLYGNEFEQKGFQDLLEVPLLDFFGDSDSVTEDVTSTLPTVKWPYDFYPLEHRHSAKGVEYLEGRGIDMAVAQSYGLRYCPPLRRVGIPITVGGRMIGFQARSIVPTTYYNEEEGVIYETPKITTTKGLRRDLVLMFGDCLPGSRHAVVCEGPFDAMKAHLCGGTVATMGKAISDSQIKALRDSGVEKVYLALDPDAAAEMDRVVRALGDRELYQLQPSRGYKDLGEMPGEAVYEQFLRAPKIYGGMSFVYFRFG